MQDIKTTIITRLQMLGIPQEEAVLYSELVKEPATHLKLSRRTGINRTKVYRLIGNLERHGLVMRRSDDTGTVLVAGDPTVLESTLVEAEEDLTKKRTALESLHGVMEMLQGSDANSFAVYTYEGVEGMKQMHWHELKTKGELLVLGNVTIEQMVGSRRWAEQLRHMAANIGYSIREIINMPYENAQFTDCDAFMTLYTSRKISHQQLPISTPVIIYNDTVATYQLAGDQKFGVEIVSKAYANTVRHMFEHYWSIATPVHEPGAATSPSPHKTLA